MSYNISMPWYKSQSQPNLGGVGNVGASAMLAYAGEDGTELGARTPPGGTTPGSMSRGLGMSPAAKRRWDQEDRAEGDYREDRQFQMSQQKLRNQMMQQLLATLTGGGGAGSSVNVQQVQDLMNSAIQQRQNTFYDGSIGRVDTGYRGGDVQGLINQYNQALDPKALTNSLVRDQAMQQQQGNYATAMRDTQAGVARGMPQATGDARMANLARSNMAAKSGIDRGMAIDSFNRRDSLMGALGQLLGQDRAQMAGGQQANMNASLAERTGRLGNPEQSAQLNLQGQMANAQIAAQQRAQMVQMLSGMMGGQ